MTPREEYERMVEALDAAEIADIDLTFKLSLWELDFIASEQVDPEQPTENQARVCGEIADKLEESNG